MAVGELALVPRGDVAQGSGLRRARRREVIGGREGCGGAEAGVEFRPQRGLRTALAGVRPERVALKYCRAYTFGASVIMFCSPQPKGIWTSWSRPFMVLPIKSPTTLTAARALPGTRSAGSEDGSVTAPEVPFTSTFCVTTCANPSGMTRIAFSTASEAEPSADAAEKVRERGPRALGVTLNCAVAEPPPAGRETWTDAGPPTEKAPAALGWIATVAVVAAASVE